MHRIGAIWEQVVDMDNLYTAYCKARMGKRRWPDMARFTLDLEPNLLALQRELVAGEYAPGPYRQFTVYERKPRLISVAPFRDRMAHHAMMNVLEPLLDKRFIPDTYACRRDKSAHRAVERYQQFARDNAYVLKLDIARYFPSVDRTILKQQLARRIKDRIVLALLHRIIDGGPESTEPVRFFPGDDLVSTSARPRGLPIGNLTSQFLANLYLDEFDHWLKKTQRVKGYLRSANRNRNDRTNRNNNNGFRLAQSARCPESKRGQVAQCTQYEKCRSWAAFVGLGQNSPFKWAVSTIGLLILSACHTGSLQHEELNENLERWRSHGVTNYRMIFQVNCYCDRASLRSMIVDVRKGLVHSAVYEDDGTPVSSFDVRDVHSIFQEHSHSKYSRAVFYC